MNPETFLRNKTKKHAHTHCTLQYDLLVKLSEMCHINSSIKTHGLVLHYGQYCAVGKKTANVQFLQKLVDSSTYLRTFSYLIFLVFINLGI